MRDHIASLPYIVYKKIHSIKKKSAPILLCHEIRFHPVISSKNPNIWKAVESWRLCEIAFQSDLVPPTPFVLSKPNYSNLSTEL